MFESLIGLVAIIALFVIISRQQSRIGLVERELGALRSLVLSGAVPQVAKPSEQIATDSEPADVVPAVAAADMASPAVSEANAAQAPAPEPVAVTSEAVSGPWAAGEPKAAEPAEPTAAANAPGKPDIETALGTRWAVWVGGIALALGGLFLIRYTIEAGIFGPGVRLTMAAVLGLVLVAAGEFIRRTGFKVPVQ